MQYKISAMSSPDNTKNIISRTPFNTPTEKTEKVVIHPNPVGTTREVCSYCQSPNGCMNCYMYGTYCMNCRTGCSKDENLIDMTWEYFSKNSCAWDSIDKRPTSYTNFIDKYGHEYNPSPKIDVDLVVNPNDWHESDCEDDDYYSDRDY